MDKQPSFNIDTNGESNRRLNKRKSTLPHVSTWSNTSSRAELHVVTPQIAKMLLQDRNRNNRKLKQDQVRKICFQLMHGLWQLNGETIVLDQDANLANGQHRLTACVKTGISFETWVIFGVPRKAIKSMDRVSKRSAADYLGMELKLKNANCLAATLAVLAMDEKNQLASFVYPDEPDVDDLLERHPDILKSVAFASGKPGFLRTVSFPSRILAFLHYRFSQYNAEKADLFFSGFTNGSNLGDRSPILQLRDIIMKYTNESRTKIGTRVPQLEYMALMIKAFNLFISGRTVAKLKWSSEDRFPEYPR